MSKKSPSKWVRLTDEMEADFIEGYFNPLEFSPKGDKVKVYTHDMRGYGEPICQRCRLYAQDYDAAETPCIPRDILA